MPADSLTILKRERTVLRTSFTKSSNKIRELLKCNREDVEEELGAQIELLGSRYESMLIKDDEISTLLCADPEIADEVLEEEQAKVDFYSLMYLQDKRSVEKTLLKNKANETLADNSSVGELQSKYKLPILKLREFDGQLQEWLPFWSQFKKIHEDPSMHDVDKLGYLSMSMTVGSLAKQLVDSYPATGEMYLQVVEALKNRFGREDLLTEFYIRELLKLILQCSAQLPLAKLYDSILSHLRNLELLNITTDNCAAILMPLVSSCLPQDLLQIWERSQFSRSSSSKDCLKNLLDFLKNEVEGSQKMELVKAGFGISPANTNPKIKFERREFKKVQDNNLNIPTAAGLINVTDKYLCLFCRQEHKPQDCKTKMSLEEKQEKLQQAHVCYCCFKHGHRAAHCRQRPKCTLCGKSHYSIMCSKTAQASNSGKLLANKSTQNHSLTSTTIQANVLMQTLVVKVYGTNGKTKLARLLFDTGSQRSYILSKSAVEMGYTPSHTEKIQHALFGGEITNACEYNVYKINISEVNDLYQCNFDVLGQDKICTSVCTIPPGPWIEELKRSNIQLSDLQYPSSVIEILVGADVAGKLYTGRLKQLSSGLVAMNTHLGWSLSGKLPSNANKCKETETQATLVTTLFLKEAQISDLWSLDILGIKDPSEKICQKELELATQQHFLETVRVKDDQRYEVNLPWIKNHPPLSDNYQLAWKRLESVHKKLIKSSMLSEYQKVFNYWEDQKIIEKVQISDLEAEGYYLPHHPVYKIGSSTPVRPVFDASAREGGTCSLNQCLEKGPNLIEKIPTCLTRFRHRKVGVSGDIEKAFLQISLNQKDRDFLRFLWIDEKGQTIIYRHCRVVFGASPSPFLLEACINLHLQDTLNKCENGLIEYPVYFVKILADSFYVDNCLTSLDSMEEAKEFTSIASSIMSERKFTLRGWELSNEDSTKPTNVLGMLWHKKEDVLSINIKSLKEMDLSKITKKVMLSAAHRVFDPIGIISSVTLIPKLLLQETWESKLSWNDEVGPDIESRFIQWIKEVPIIEEIKIPRCISSLDLGKSKLSIHVFSDASKLAYSAAIFLRVEGDSEVTIQLLASRSRVAPTSKNKSGMTIPRLELLAASIATRLYKTIVEDFKLQGTQTIFWTDATTVLAWIKRQEPWNIFVTNRVKEIRELSNGCEWRHIPGEINPADLPSRGAMPKLYFKYRWWEGPLWLKKGATQWPQSEIKYDEAQIAQETKKIVISAINQTEDLFVRWYEYFSSYTKIVRLIAWILRFRKNCRYKKVHGFLPEAQDLSATEIDFAERKVFLLIQRESSDIMNKMESKLIFLEEDVIRLKMKVSNRTDEHDFCHPIVLPGEHPVVQRLVMNLHKENCHVGTQLLLSIIRKRFWILGGRRTIRSIIGKCVICKRYTVKNVHVESTPLPKERVRDGKVFEVTGVDLAGPLYIKENGLTKKVWVCLFTCAIYRAVRLELVSSLSTDSFIMALRRFCSRQGRPAIIYSDNGSNFVGFNNTSRDLDWEAITNYSSTKKIDWRFNPPSAPWWGGWWERLISIIKSMLKRTLGRAFVSQEEMLTILCDCECVINLRPLTYISEDPTDLVPLTPSMFLQEIEEVGVPEYDLITSSDLRKRQIYRQELTKNLRERFRTEYLGQLMLFSNGQSQRDVKIGDTVLIGDDDTKRQNWPLGRVLELIHGRDGHVRVVRVRTPTGVLTRPVQRIYPLECELEHDSVVNPITRRGRTIKRPRRFID